MTIVEAVGNGQIIVINNFPRIFPSFDKLPEKHF